MDWDKIGNAGVSTSGTRWLTNPLRRLFWLIGRPYFSRLQQDLLELNSAAENRMVAGGGGIRAAQDLPVATAPLFVPAGHFYSPIVDPTELERSGFAPRRHLCRDLPGIELDVERLRGTFEALARHLPDVDFPEQQSPSHRYYYENGMFSYGDALVLAAMIREFRPRRIIEVGSGFSSAAILDTLDRMPGGSDTNCVFIEPHDERLRGLLRSGDVERATIITQPVQSVPMHVFEHLAAGDFLFLDTTHVAKTGSDVVHEMLEILPRLASGVLIHIHDVFHGFEYPEEWIYRENRSWNELYLLRAFLMYNDHFEIVFFIGDLCHEYRDLIAARCPLILRNIGGGLWLRKR